MSGAQSSDVSLGHPHGEALPARGSSPAARDAVSYGRGPISRRVLSWQATTTVSPLLTHSG